LLINNVHRNLHHLLYTYPQQAQQPC